MSPCDFIFDQLGRRELGESDGHFLRLGFAAADHGERNGGAGIALQQELRLVNSHLAGGKSGDFFEDVAFAQADFRGGAIGEDADHADVAEAAGERESRFAGGGGVGGLVLVILIFKRAEVGGLRVERIEQAVQSAVGDGVHIGIVHVVALDVFEDFAIDGERAIGLVVVGAAEHVAGGGVGDDQDGKPDDYLFPKWTHATFPFGALMMARLVQL